MAAWTLEHDGTTQTLEAWGADNSATLTLTNQQPGVLTLHFPGLQDADMTFGYKEKIILRKDDAIIFRGHAMPPRRTGEGSTEGITMQFVDAWWFLANGTITQTIYDGRNSAASRNGTITDGSPTVSVASASGIVVGMTVVGSGIPAGSTITAITGLNLTLSHNATITGTVFLAFIKGSNSAIVALFARLTLGSTYGLIDLSDTLSDIIAAADLHHGGGIIQMGACSGSGWSVFPMPVDIAGTFANAVMAVLQFAPDAIPQLDYTTDPPTINFIQRSAAAVKTLAFPNASAQLSQEITARQDLLVTGVRILYRGYLVDGTPSTVLDAAGDSAGPGVLQVEMSLNPPGELPHWLPPVAEKQSIEVEAIDVASADWWMRNANLAVADSSDIVVGDGCTLELNPDAPENDGASDMTNIDGCSNRILQGSIPTWLNVSAHLRYVRATGYLTIRVWNDPDDHDKGYTLSQETVHVDCAATDLITNEYENLVSVGGWQGGTFDPESVPMGVAAKVLASLSVLQYEGAINLVNDECDFDAVPGRVLNITGGRAEWAAMKAQIQGVTHRLHFGATSFNFGPSAHLAPQDYLQLQRNFQKLRIAMNLALRASGSIPGGGVSTQVRHPQTTIRSNIKRSGNIKEKRDVDGSGQVTQYTQAGKQVWTDGTTEVTIDAGSQLVKIVNGSKSITLDLTSLPSSGEAMFRPVTICADGVQLLAYVLMTPPA